MKKIIFLIGLVLLISSAYAQSGNNSKEAKMKSAMSAAPDAISQNATIMDWPASKGAEMTMLREGKNGFTCLPDMPDTPGNDPMCLDEPWMKWAEAWMGKSDVNISRIGFGYMLQGGTPESNTDPYAEGPTTDNEWIKEGVPHLMIIVPDPSTLEGLPVTSGEAKGGPWVMWRDTPYVHIMVPTPKHSPQTMSSN